MKILCVADLHVGAGGSLRSDHLGDQKAVLSQIVTVACDEQVDLLLMAGDVFHRPNPSVPALNVFRGFTRHLELAQIPAVACVGNCGHDLVNAAVVSALELFDSEWFRVSRVPELIKAAGDIAVCTLPSVPVHRLVARHDGGDRSVIFDEAVELLLQAARELRDQVPEGWPAVLMGHWSVAGAHLPNGLPVADLHEPVLPIERLDEIGFDAMVFGHIHEPQKLGSGVGAFYAGSPLVVDFGEAHVDHGAWLLEGHDGGGCDTRFVPLDDRPFVTVDVDLTDENAFGIGDDETDAIAGAVTLPVEGAVVRVRYRATEDQHRRVDRQALLGFLADAGADKVHGPVWEPVRTTRARVEVDGDGMNDHDALDLWLDAADVPREKGTGVHALLDRLEGVAGATFVEYALLLAVLSVGVVVALLALIGRLS